MEHRPAITLLRHYSNTIKVQDISDFNMNVNRSTSQQTCFADKDVLQQKMAQQRNKHLAWMDSRINLSEQECRNAAHEFKYDYIFGNNHVHKKQKYDRPTESRVGRVSFDDPQKKENYYVNTRRFFDFNQINESRKQFKQYSYNEDKTPFSLREIEMLGTKDFNQKFRKRVGYEELVMEQNRMTTNPATFFECEADGRQTLSKYLKTKGFNFQVIKPQNAMKYGIYSEDIQINFLDLFEIRNKRDKYKQEYIPSNFYKEPIQQIHLIGFASGYYENGILKIFMDERKNKNKITERIQMENQLEVQINAIKTRIKTLRQQKTHRKNRSIHHMGTQVEKMIVDDPLRDLLFFDSEQALKNIENLNIIKTEKIKEGVSPIQVYGVIHPQLQTQLLSLLMTIIECQKFISISEFLAKEDLAEIDSMILDAINQNIESLEGKLTKNGMSKMQILRQYTSQKLMMKRQTNEIKKILEKKNKPAIVKSRQASRSVTPPRKHLTNKSVSKTNMANSMVEQKVQKPSKVMNNSSVNADFVEKSRMVVEPDLMYKLARSVVNLRHVKRSK